MRNLGSGVPADLAVAWRNIAMMIGHWHMRGYGPWVVAGKESGEIRGRAGLWNAEGGPGVELGWMMRRSALRGAAMRPRPLGARWTGRGGTRMSTTSSASSGHRTLHRFGSPRSWVSGWKRARRGTERRCTPSAFIGAQLQRPKDLRAPDVRPRRNSDRLATRVQPCRVVAADVDNPAMSRSCSRPKSIRSSSAPLASTTLTPLSTIVPGRHGLRVRPARLKLQLLQQQQSQRHPQASRDPSSTNRT